MCRKVDNPLICDLVAAQAEWCSGVHCSLCVCGWVGLEARFCLRKLRKRCGAVFIRGNGKAAHVAAVGAIVSIPPLRSVHRDAGEIIEHALAFKGQRKFKRVCLALEFIPFIPRGRSARDGMVIMVAVLIEPSGLVLLLFVIE